MSYKQSYLIALILLLSLTGARSGVRAQSIFLQPDAQYVTTGVGTEFDLELRVDASITSIKSFIYHVDFDPTKLDTVSITQGPLLPSSGGTTAFGKYIVNDSILQLEDLILGAGIDASGPGLLATIRFRVLDTGTVTLTVVNHRVRDVDGTLLPTQAYGCVIYVNVPPAPFDLLNPPSGENLQGLPGDDITLSWEASSSVYPGESITYTLEYGTSATFEAGATTTVPSLAANSFDVPVSSLTEGYEGSYYWRVTALGTVNGYERLGTPASEYFVFSYTHVPPEPFNLVSPVGGESITGLPGDDVVFSWQATTSRFPFEQIVYQLEYSRSSAFPGFGTRTVTGITTNSYSVDVGDLEWGYEGDYYWRVTATGSINGLTTASTPGFDHFAFAYEHLPPEPFDLLSPASTSTHSSGSLVLFKWQNAASQVPGDNVTYVLVISSDPTIMTDTLLSSSVSVSEAYIVLTAGEPGFPRNLPLYWRVTAVSSHGMSRASTSIFSFTITSCCEGRVGDVNGDGEYPDEITLGDIMLLVDVKFVSGDCNMLPCIQEADVNQDGGVDPTCEEHVTLSDIMYLVDFLFITGPDVATLNDCL